MKPAKGREGIDPQSILLGFGQPLITLIHRNVLLVNTGDAYPRWGLGSWVYMETILLVDDNPLRAAMRKSLLENKTAEVVRALDAAEALCLVESPELANGLALVITGHAMTGISGPEFVGEFRSRMPHVPVLVMSSTADAEQEYRGIPGVFVSRTTSVEDLRAIAGRLVGMGQRQTA
jgi:CheY-like chemotaxis protein